MIISGEIAAGKTTAADHLEKSGFSTTRYSKVVEKRRQNKSGNSQFMTAAD